MNLSIQTLGVLPMLLSLLLSITTASLFANNIDVYDYEATVIDENGKPMVAVNVYTDDYEKVSDYTDERGKVILKDLNYKDRINFSFVGYETLSLQFFEIRNRGGIVQMKPQAVEIGVTVEVVGRRDDLPEEVPYDIQKVDKKDIALTNSQTAADALRDHGGVFVQKSQMGGGSPNIRGFEANRVLLVIDGVRMNNAIYRNGHLQNAITVDNSMLERMEVIFGPGSLMYGSDALGGVIHFRSKDPKLYFGNKIGGYEMETNAYTRYSSANSEGTFHVDINYGAKKWGSLTSFSYTDFGDLTAGSRRPEGYETFGKRQFFIRRVDGVDQLIANQIEAPDTLSLPTPNYNEQIGTAYAQWDMMQKVRFQPNEHTYFIANFQFSSSTNVPRYDNLAETKSTNPSNLKWADWYYGPQKRFLTSLKARILKPNRFYDKATIIAAFQRLNEDRFKRKFKKAWTEFSLEDVNVYSFTGDFDKYLNGKEQLVMAYGFDFSHNTVESTGGRIDANRTTVLYDQLSRYPGNGSTMTSAGAYANLKWKSRDSTLNIDASLRYSQVSLDAKFSLQDTVEVRWPDEYISGIGTNNGALTYGIGLTYNTRNNWQFRLLGASAFRSPNIDDFAKIREKNDFVTTPNPDLKPEYSYTGELTVAKEIGDFSEEGGTAVKLSTTGFFTYLKDAMVRRTHPIFPGGQTFIIASDGSQWTTQANLNAENARVYGFSANAYFKLGQFIKLQSGINITKGRQSFRKYDEDLQIQIDTLTPLSHIPPLYGQTTLSFENERLTLSAVVRYNGKKEVSEYAVSDIYFDSNGEMILEREGTSDNLDLSYSRIVNINNDNTIFEYDGTLAWTTYNFYSSFRFGKNLNYSIDFAVENILDLHYRPFASGISAPGRNFIAALRAKF